MGSCVDCRPFQEANVDGLFDLVAMDAPAARFELGLEGAARRVLWQNLDSYE
jgi:hypothetical protein